MSRIFLLIHNPLFAARLRAIVDASPGLETVGWVTTLDQARVQLEAALPDLVLADLQLADGPFASLLAALCGSGRYGRPKSLVLAAGQDESRLIAALRHGADSHVPGSAPAEALQAAIHQVLRGEADMAPGIARQLHRHFATRERLAATHAVDGGTRSALSDPERRVLQALADGYAQQDICRALFLTSQELGRLERSIYRRLQRDLDLGAHAAPAA